MTRVDFYHLQSQNIENFLPKLVEKAYETNKRIKILTKENMVENINKLLWTYSDQSFLPHGTKKESFSELQPIYISSGEENPNQSVLLFLIDNKTHETTELNDYERIFCIFDGNSEENLQNARTFWKNLKMADFELFYWQQDNSGKWQLKAS